MALLSMKSLSNTVLLFEVLLVSSIIAVSLAKDLSSNQSSLQNIENSSATINATDGKAIKARTSQEKTDLSPGGYRLFKTNGEFIVPPGKTRIRVLAVGGGGGGGNGHAGGGGSGYVNSATLMVNPGATIPVTVGKGGAGAVLSFCATSYDCNELWENEDGGESSFGCFRAAGGKTPSNRFVGGNGGSGGGGGGGSAGCDSQGTIGGYDGSNGANCRLSYYTKGYESPKGGTGQGRGTFTAMLSIFKANKLAAGEAGTRTSANGSWLSGSGGGGVKINNSGPSGTQGADRNGAGGGVGYGGGGGAGGYAVGAAVDARQAGGRGADGVVYVEWD